MGTRASSPAAALERIEAERRRLEGGRVVPFPVETEIRDIPELAPVAAIQRRESVYRRLLALADVGSAALAVLITLSVLGDDQIQPILLLAIPLVAVVAKLQGLYDRDALLLNKTTLDEAPKLFQVATLYVLLLNISDGYFIEGDLSSKQSLGVWFFLFFLAMTARAGARVLARRTTETERCLLIGTRDDAERLSTKFAQGQNLNAQLIGRIPLNPTDSIDDISVLGTIEDMGDVILKHAVHRVIVAPHGSDSERMLDAVRAAKAYGVQVSVLPRLLEVIGSSVEFDHLSGVTVMGIRRFGLSRSSALVKRALDATAAAVGLFIMAPLLVALAVLIKRSSPGPVFFRQERIGRDGRPFEMLKFRSMVADAEAQKHLLRSRNEAAEGLFKIAEDPRITPIGRFLRRTSLDELPQFINVLRGEMSLVGPRPLVPDEDRRIEGRHRRRLHLKPGMTGQWQIFGSSKIPLREMVTIDYLYVANWSLWGDIKILCRTVPHVLAQRGL